MNREILFRGKRLYDGNWVYGDYLKNHHGWHSIVEQTPEAYYYDIDPDTVDPDTVGQYTGMTDRNGKKIFEGDIIMVFSTFGFNADSFVTEVVFMDRAGMRGFSLKNGRSLFYFAQKDLNKLDDAEVIGNRWDNPELLGLYRIDTYGHLLLDLAGSKPHLSTDDIITIAEDIAAHSELQEEQTIEAIAFEVARACTVTFQPITQGGGQ